MKTSRDTCGTALHTGDRDRRSTWLGTTGLPQHRPFRVDTDLDGNVRAGVGGVANRGALRWFVWSRLALVGWMSLGGLCLAGAASGPPAVGEAKKSPAKVREAAVAGLFYSSDKAELAESIDKLLAAANPAPLPRIRALVCPHAGYLYSGPTAAYAYKAVQGRPYRTVIVLAPSHYAAFAGVAVSQADAYRTPLGLTPISSIAAKLAAVRPFLAEPVCRVQRPAWSRQSPLVAPPLGKDTPETWEHSLEVQLPFLQRALTNFELVPAIVGEADPALVARALSPFVDTNTLLIASSDLSHYHPYDQAKDLDQQCVKDLCDLNLEGMQEREACGKSPILAVMHLARQKGWKPKLLDYRNSGDTAGDRSGVVGYAAVAFYEPASGAQLADPRKQLLQLARQTLEEWVRQHKKPVPDKSRFPAEWSEPKGCFVTLTKQGELRGCIGHIFPQEALLQAVVDNACSAATQDPRFPPVTTAELSQIKIEISLLTVPSPLAFRSTDELLSKLRPNVDGVVLKIGARGATYLPQVWEQLADKVQFLNHLSEKAGCPSGAWRNSGVEVLVYQVEAFDESGAKPR
jgi:MEMO1 family protein